MRNETSLNPGPAFNPGAAGAAIPTLAQIAAEEFARTGEARTAAQAMARRLFEDDVLREALLEPIVDRICTQAVSEVIRGKRDRVWNPPPQPSAAAGRRRVKVAAAVNRMSLMNFLLPGGKRLGDATGAEVAAAAVFFLKQGRDMMVKGRWCHAIAQAVAPNKVVRRVLDDARLQALRETAEAAA